MIPRHSKSILRRTVCYAQSPAHIDVSEDVKTALKKQLPIVALESTIITHGMPYPSNLQTALEVEEIVRKNGSVPATIAILDGRIKVGQTNETLTTLANKQNEAIKCSRRDLPYVVGKGKTGGTTVCGTMIIAHMLGLKIFATGGIGGVHRNGQNTLDISADLVELGRTPVAVVCSGVKSILDIPRTLEFLETQGVCVATYGDANHHFPDFYTRDSGSKAPYNLDGPADAAKLITTLAELNLQSGILIAAPIPVEFALEKNTISTAIDEAYQKANKEDIVGKDITPFLLEAVSNITKGSSLDANIALIKNNAAIAAQIAKELYGNPEICVNYHPHFKPSAACNKLVPLIIGASMLDLSLTMHTWLPETLNGATYPAKAKQSAGGVGRNLAEGIFKLHGKANLVSVVGDDELGQNLLRLMPPSLRKTITVDKREATALCSLIFDKTGDCKLILANMEIHQRITPERVMQQENLFKEAPLVIIDSNLSIATIECVLQLAIRYKRPVFFEPTDMIIAGKPFTLPPHLTSAIKIVSPNLYELKKIVETITQQPVNHKININAETATILQQTKEMLTRIQDHFDCILVTLGQHGAVVSVRNENKPLFDEDSGRYQYQDKDSREKHSMKFYAAPSVEKITNVSGAGDSLSSGFITGLIRGYNVERCIALGFLAAERALKSQSAVPESYFVNEEERIKDVKNTEHKLKIIKI